MQPKIVEKYFFFGLLLTTFVFTFLIFRPFWIVLALGISFSIALYPLYEWLSNRKLPDWLSALLTILVFTIVLCGPILGIGITVFNQSQDVYHKVINNGSAEPFLNSIENKINNILPAITALDINQKIKDSIFFVSKNIAGIFSATISAFFSFLLMLLIIFYFLKDGKKWKKYIITLSPLDDQDDEKIISRLIFSVNAVMKGYLFVSLIQGILVGVGFWLFGIPSPALWGLVAAIASLLPTVGTALVSVPAIIFLFVTGNSVFAIGLLIWSMVVVGLVDNFLSPFIIGKKINIPSLLILFSALGGISLLGPVGILIGPLTLSLLYTLILIYRNEFKQNTIL